MSKGCCYWSAHTFSRYATATKLALSAADPVALADYIYHGWREGPASAEGAIAALHPGAWGKKPLSQRLPQIPVTRIEMIYGVREWMDMRQVIEWRKLARSKDLPRCGHVRCAFRS